uniref:SusC/RagA family TonB-linked outer membrane protein n=1 Tax=Pedobacter schmidteae TaxID=2201271 RepID=UPI000EAC28EA|nr:SusC/RagA family TonB-linked outer membrane protein [Pedobacter schmidteae]
MKLNTFNLGVPKWLPPKFLLIVKVIIIIMTACLMQVSAATFAQLVTLKERNLSLEDAFGKIRKQTGYDFIFDADLLKTAGRINLDLKKASLREALSQCLAGQGLTFEIQAKSVTIIKKSLLDNLSDFLRAIDVKGKVTDEKGNPLPGAVIKVNGTNIRAAANVNGEFKLSGLDKSATLSISYVGYKTREITLKDNRELVIVLEEAQNEMDEVVINTGIFRKVDKSFTGASTTVNINELKASGNRNLLTSLRNIDPSFNMIENNLFGGDPNRIPEIQIRGNSSLPNINQLQDGTRVGLNTPLIILDGFESTLQRLMDMNENEVESITILKDASATAIYGSRGANGVIVITTKAPQLGKLRITYRNDMNIEMPDLTGYDVLDARQKLELERRVGLYDNPRPQFDIPLKAYYNYLLNEVNSGVNTYWLSKPLHTAIGQRHNLRIEGGDESFRYSASAQYNDEQGVMKKSFHRTFNGTINLTYIFRNIRFTNSLMIGTGNNSNSPYGSFSDYVKQNPYWRAYDENGNVIKVLGDPGDASFSSRWGSLPTNPLYNATLNTFDLASNTTITNNFSFGWKIYNDLQLRARLGVTKESRQSDNFKPAAHTDFANYAVADVFRKGSYAYGTGNALNYDGSINLSYSKIINEKHSLFAGLDYNVRQDKGTTYSFLAEGFSNAKLDFLSMALQYAPNSKPSGTESLSRAIGITSNVNYTYDNRYFADLSLRMDGSSQFGIQNRFAPFWSAGLGWNMEQEGFLKELDFINKLKLRASTGITGSQNFNAYQALSTYRYYSKDRYYNEMGAYLLGLGNEELKWQQKRSFNIGVEAQLFDNRVSLVADYYADKTVDLVSAINLPISNGFSSYIGNIGSMQNRGFEIKATAYVIRKEKGLTWSVSGAVINNNNKITSISQAMKDAVSAIEKNGGANPNLLYKEGYSTNTIWVVPSLGIDPGTGKEVYLSKDGNSTYIWNPADLRAVGISEPKYLGNLSTMFRYKGFSTNITFGYRYGGQLYNSTLIDKVENADYRYNVDARVYNNRWQNPGDNAAFKGLLVTTPTNMTSRFVQDEKTFMCRNINVQYDVKSKTLRKSLGIESLLFSGNGADLFYISTVKRERGTAYPFSKRFSLSMSATF